MRASWGLLVLCVAMAGATLRCGSSDATSSGKDAAGGGQAGSGGASGVGGSSGAGGSSATGGVGGTSGADGSVDGASGSAGASGGAAGAAGNGPMFASLTMDTTSIPVDTVVTKCQDFANPFGRDVWIRTFSSVMSTTSVYPVIFAQLIAGAHDGALVDCNASDALTPAPIFASQVPQETLQFPAGVGVRVPAGDGVRITTTWVNGGTSAFNAHVMLSLTAAAPGPASGDAGLLIFTDTGLSVLRGVTFTASVACAVPAAISVVAATGHLLHYGTFGDVSWMSAEAAGATLFSSDPYLPSAAKPQIPALALASTSTVSLSCTYLIPNGGGPLTYGTNPITDEQCTLWAYYFPALASGTSVVDCQ